MKKTENPTNDARTESLDTLKKTYAYIKTMKDEELVAEVTKADAFGIKVADYINSCMWNALHHALIAGYALQTLKLRHKVNRDWCAFLKEKIPDLAPATAHRYVKLAEHFPNPNDVPAAMSITEAYRLSGILPQSGANPKKATAPSETAKSARKPTALVSSIQSLVNTLEASFDAMPSKPAEHNELAGTVGQVIKQLQSIHSRLTAATAAPKFEMPQPCPMPFPSLLIKQ